jgi:hypothetical protein
MLCGHANLNLIASWGASQTADFLRALGFARGQAPGKSQLYELLSKLEPSHLERVLSAWAESVLRELGGAAQAPTPPLQGVALDGKTLRGSKALGAEASPRGSARGVAHLLSAVSHGVGLTLAQVGVTNKTNEIPLASVLLNELLVEGRVFTMDALLTQRALAEQISAAGGDYLMIVKDNQPTLAADIALAFEDFSPSEPATQPTGQRRSRAH